MLLNPKTFLSTHTSPDSRVRTAGMYGGTYGYLFRATFDLSAIDPFEREKKIQIDLQTEKVRESLPRHLGCRYFDSTDGRTGCLRYVTGSDGLYISSIDRHTHLIRQASQASQRSAKRKTDAAGRGRCFSLGSVTLVYSLLLKIYRVRQKSENQKFRQKKYYQASNHYK